MGHPRQITQDLDTMELFRNLPSELATKCREAYTKARARQQAVQSGQVSPLESNTFVSQGGQPKTSKSLSKTQKLTEDSPLIRMATQADAIAAIVNLGFLFGHKIHPDVAKALAKVILNGKWTSAELEYAAQYIPTNKEMCETITYNRTINPTVFAKARTHPSVMRGRTFRHKEALAFCRETDVPFRSVFEPILQNGQTKFRML